MKISIKIKIQSKLLFKTTKRRIDKKRKKRENVKAVKKKILDT